MDGWLVGLNLGDTWNKYTANIFRICLNYLSVYLEIRKCKNDALGTDTKAQQSKRF